MSFAAVFIHRLIPWITFLEVFVAVHAVVVAVHNTARFGSAALWPMFLSGFLMIFAVTQIFGLKMPAFLRVTAIACYGAGVGVVYYFRGYEKLYEIAFIPIALYTGALALPWLIAVGQKIVGLLAGGKSAGGKDDLVR